MFGSLSASSVAGTFKDLPILHGVIGALNHLIANLKAAQRWLGSLAICLDSFFLLPLQYTDANEKKNILPVSPPGKNNGSYCA